MIGVSHHVPDPGPGIVEEDFFEQTTALLQLEGEPLGPDPVAFVLRGSSEAHVFFEGPVEGDALDDDGNGLDEVATELVSLDLSGGGVSLRLQSGVASPARSRSGRTTTSAPWTCRPSRRRARRTASSTSSSRSSWPTARCSTTSRRCHRVGDRLQAAAHALHPPDPADQPRDRALRRDGKPTGIF